MSTAQGDRQEQLDKISASLRSEVFSYLDENLYCMIILLMRLCLQRSGQSAPAIPGTVGLLTYWHVSTGYSQGNCWKSYCTDTRYQQARNSWRA
jgi:hypothetical protein